MYFYVSKCLGMCLYMLYIYVVGRYLDINVIFNLLYSQLLTLMHLLPFLFCFCS